MDELHKGIMRALKTFFRTLVLSCTSPKYYADILRAKFSFSAKYLVMLQLLVAVAVSTLVVVPIAMFNVNGFLDMARTWYPSDLEISYANGHLAINQPLPYAIPISAEIGDEIGEEVGDRQIQNVVVFDSDENIRGAADVLALNSLAVVTETNLYIRDDQNGGLRMYPFPEDSESFQLTPAMVNEFITKIQMHPFIAQKLYIPFIVAFLLVFMFPIMVIAGFISAAIMGILTWIMARFLAGPLLVGELLSYSKAVQVTIHSMTLVNIAQLVLDILGQGAILDGWKYWVVFLLWTGFVLHQAYHQDTPRSGVSASSSSTSKSSKSKKKKALPSKPPTKSVASVKDTV
jgi:hypothetical protein